MSALAARGRASLLAVLAAMSLVVLDAGIVNVALPTIAESLDASPDGAILTVSAYQLALVMGLLPCAHLAEWIGCRRLFVAGLALFSGASVLCALAPSLPMLVTARFLQGLGGAAIMSLGIALLRVALGPDRLGAAIGWNALTVAICSAVGPIAGALILSIAPWPWLFLAKLPIGAIALAAAFGLPRVEPTRESVDVPSMSLWASTAASILIAAQLAIARPLPAVVLASVGLLCATLLLRREGARQAPVLPIDLLTLRPFRMSVLASICCFTGQSAGLLALSFHLQLGLGRGPISAGLVMTCWPLAVAAASQFANRLATRLGAPLLCAAGGVILGSGLLLLALWPAQETIAPLAVGCLLGGIGFGFFQTPNNRTMFLSAPPERSAAAGGLQGSARLTGQTFGTLIVSLLFACAPAMSGPRIGLAIGSMFAVAAAWVSMLEARAKPGIRHCQANAHP